MTHNEYAVVLSPERTDYVSPVRKCRDSEVISSMSLEETAVKHFCFRILKFSRAYSTLLSLELQPGTLSRAMISRPFRT